jgi:hypothetical protein
MVLNGCPQLLQGFPELDYATFVRPERKVLRTKSHNLPFVADSTQEIAAVGGLLRRFYAFWR